MSLRRLDPLLLKDFITPFRFCMVCDTHWQVNSDCLFESCRMDGFGRRLLSSQNDVSSIAAWSETGTVASVSALNRITSIKCVGSRCSSCGSKSQPSVYLCIASV